MKASDLIRVLTEQMTEHGDLDVFLPTEAENDAPEYGDCSKTAGVAAMMGGNDKADYFLICDFSTAEAME